MVAISLSGNIDAPYMFGVTALTGMILFSILIAQLPHCLGIYLTNR